MKPTKMNLASVVLIVSLISFSSCETKQSSDESGELASEIPDGYVLKTLQPGGKEASDPINHRTITYAIPSDWDTTYTWRDQSDCSCCGMTKTRSQSSLDKILKETGFFKVGNYLVQPGITIGVGLCQQEDSSFLSPAGFAERFILNGKERRSDYWMIFDNKKIKIGSDTMLYTWVQMDGYYDADSMFLHDEQPDDLPRDPDTDHIVFQQLSAYVYFENRFIKIYSTFEEKDKDKYLERFERILSTLRIK